MAKRTKQVVWHKKQQKLINSTLLKPHHTVPAQESSAAPDTSDRKKLFALDLLKKIRRAVRENP